MLEKPVSFESCVIIAASYPIGLTIAYVIVLNLPLVGCDPLLMRGLPSSLVSPDSSCCSMSFWNRGMSTSTGR